MADDFYRDEHPSEPGGGGGGGSGGGSGGGWSGGGGGSGGGGSGGLTGDWRPGEDEPWTGRWIWEDDDGPSLPYLRLSENGELLYDDDGYLLIGTERCKMCPAVLMFLDKESVSHLDCILCRLGGTTRRFQTGVFSDLFLRYGMFSWQIPGKFELQAKWQAGHYDYTKLSEVDLKIYGVSFGPVALPLNAWRRIATIEVTEDSVYVNGIKGDVNGNSKFLE